MSTPLANVLAYLAADVTLAAIHGGRVSENRSPQRDAFPRQVIEATGRTGDVTHDGPCSNQKLGLRVQSQALTKADAEAMDERVGALLNGFRGTIGTMTVQGGFKRDAPDDFESAIDASEKGVFVIAADYDLWFVVA